MTEHERIMDGLLADRENSMTKRTIVKLTPTELRAELEARECNLSGEIYVLQDRLLRAVLREDAQLRNELAWYPCDEMDAEGEALHETFMVKRKRIERNVWRNRVWLHGALKPIQVMSSQGEWLNCCTGARARRNHVMSAMPFHTFPGVIKPYSSGELRVTSAMNAPQLSLNREFDSYLRQAPGEWEFYSAEHVRKIRTSVPDNLIHRAVDSTTSPMDSVGQQEVFNVTKTPMPTTQTEYRTNTQPTPIEQSNRRVTCEWFTPVQRFAEAENTHGNIACASSGSKIENMPPHRSKRKNVAFRPRRVNLREVKLREKLNIKEIERTVLEGESEANTVDSEASDRHSGGRHASSKTRTFKRPKIPFNDQLKRRNEEVSSEEDAEYIVNRV